MPLEISEDPPFERLAREVRRLFHQLRASAERLHGDVLMTAAHRAILESLYRDGPQTVPALARARPVSRQHVQVLANRLLETKLVEATANPANKRSPFLALTDAGRKLFESMRRREHRALAVGKLPISERELLAAAKTLRELRQFLAATFPSPD